MVPGTQTYQLSIVAGEEGNSCGATACCSPSLGRMGSAFPSMASSPWCSWWAECTGPRPASPCCRVPRLSSWSGSSGSSRP